MAGVNKVMLIGRLGRDPELKYLQDGREVCNFSMATSQIRKDKSGEKKESTEWHKVVFFGAFAAAIGKYTSKGSLVYVEGFIRTRSWEDKSGNKKQITEIVGQNCQFLDSKKEEANHPAEGEGNGDLPPGADDDVPF